MAHQRYTPFSPSGAWRESPDHWAVERQAAVNNQRAPAVGDCKQLIYVTIGIAVVTPQDMAGFMGFTIDD